MFGFILTHIAALVTGAGVIASAGARIMMVVELVAVAIVIVIVVGTSIVATTVSIVVIVVLIPSVVWPVIALGTRVHVIAGIAVVVVAAAATHCAASSWNVVAATTHFAMKANKHAHNKHKLKYRIFTLAFAFFFLSSEAPCY